VSEGLKLELLGGVSLCYDEAPLAGFVSTKAQALLCYLVVMGQVHARSKLADLFWSDRTEAEARANLRVTLTNLRQLVAPYLTITRQTVAFNPQPDYYLDVTHFQSGCRMIGTVPTEASMSHLQQAIAVYQGDLLAGLHVRGAPMFDEWLLLQREHLRRQAIQALYTLAAYHTTRGEFAAAIDYTQQLLAIEPWHEESHRQLMLLLALTGQRSQALARYEICHQTLTRELGITPSDETTTLYQNILDGQFNSPTHAAATLPTAQSNSPYYQEPLPFVGRGSAYAWLFDQWQAARARQGQITLIEGTAGIGKTRLVEAVLHHAAGMGTRLLIGRCAAFEQAMPYQPVGEVLRSLFRNDPSAFDALNEIWLNELTCLLPEMVERYPKLLRLPATSDDGARMRLFEAVAQIFATLDAHDPAVIVFFDDLHTVDPATTDLLRYLSERLQHTAIWWVGTYRPEALAANPPMLRLRHDLAQTRRVAQLHLPALDAAAIAQLVAHLPGLAREQAGLLTEFLSVCSEGNAFILAQFLQELERSEILRTGSAGLHLDSRRLVQQSITIPAGVQALIQQWLQGLTPAARALLDLAALIGRTFDLQVLEQAAGMAGAEFYRALELLPARRIIHKAHSPTPPETLHETLEFSYRQHLDGVGMLHWSDDTTVPSTMNRVEYAFTYQIVQQVVYAGLSPGHRRQLREQVVWAYEQLEDTFKPVAQPLPAGWQERDALRKTA
jgi:DNA-binding SARP family transcriptional activator